MIQSKGGRSALVVVGVWIMLLGLARPAAGQVRDPFDPVVDTSTETTTDTGQTTSSTDSAGVAETTTTTTTTQTTADEGTLPATGASVSSWLAIAYVLVAAGVGLLGVARALGDGADARRAREKRDSAL